MLLRQNANSTNSQEERIVLEFETKRKPETRRQSVNDAVYQWYHLVRQRSVLVGGSTLQAEASSSSLNLKLLQSFKNHFGLTQLTVSGEVADVPQETKEGWFERLKLLIQGRTSGMKMKKAAFIGHSLLEKGEKKSKGCFTVAFFWPIIPVLIGKSIKSRCFKGLKKFEKKPHGAPYYFNTDD